MLCLLIIYVAYEDERQEIMTSALCLCKEACQSIEQRVKLTHLDLE